MSAVFLSSLSQAQCEQRNCSKDELARWMTRMLVGNLLVYDSLLMGTTDLLCNNPLYENLFGNNEAAIRRFFEPDKSSTVPLQVVALDGASFAEVADRLLDGNTSTGVEEEQKTIRERARILDLCNIPIIRYEAGGATDFPTALNTLKDRYCANLVVGFGSLGVENRYPREVTPDERQAALAIAQDIHGRIEETRLPLSQTAVWNRMNAFNLSSTVRTELQRLSDLAYQCAMGRGTPGHLSSFSGKDSRFIQATFWSEPLQQLWRPEELPSPKVTLDGTLSLIIQSEALAQLTLEEARALRDAAPLIELREFLRDARQSGSPSDYLLDLGRRLQELEYPLKVLAVEDEYESRAIATSGLLELIRKKKLKGDGIEKLSALLMPHISDAAKKVATVASGTTALLAGATPLEMLSAAMIGGAVAEFGPLWVGAKFKSLQFRSYLPPGSPPVTENLINTARAVADVRGLL